MPYFLNELCSIFSKEVKTTDLFAIKSFQDLFFLLVQVRKIILCLELCFKLSEFPHHYILQLLHGSQDFAFALNLPFEGHSQSFNRKRVARILVMSIAEVTTLTMKSRFFTCWAGTDGDEFVL